MVVAIGDVYIAFPVYLAAMGPVQSRPGGVSTVAVSTQVPAGNRGDNVGCGVDAADGVVFGINHNDVTQPVAPDGFRRTPGGQQSRSAISAVSPFLQCRPG